MKIDSVELRSVRLPLISPFTTSFSTQTERRTLILKVAGTAPDAAGNPSDVVGLGKTYMSALLAQHLNEPCLVIAPPHLLDEHNPGSWPNVFREFGVRGYLCESLGKLESLLDRDLQKFTTVFIDESHRFRTEDTQS